MTSDFVFATSPSDRPKQDVLILNKWNLKLIIQRGCNSIQQFLSTENQRDEEASAPLLAEQQGKVSSFAAGLSCQASMEEKQWNNLELKNVKKALFVKIWKSLK